MKARKYRIISNIVIISIFVMLITYIGTSNYQYVFSYQNEDVIYNGNKDSNKVSLMINVYWGTEYIDDILDVLDEYQISTTFFVGGTWVEKEENTFKQIVSKGHEIGNHGFFHKEQEHLNYEQNYEEIKVTNDLVKVISGIQMNLFAPPSGSFNKATVESANDLGYKTIMWSKDTIDWRDHDKNVIFRRAVKNLSNGDLVLMHPTKETLEALDDVLAEIKRQNFEVVAVSNNLK